MVFFRHRCLWCHHWTEVWLPHWTLLFWWTILEKSRLPTKSHLLPTATCTLLTNKKPKFYMEMTNLLCFLCSLEKNLFKALLQRFSLEHQKSTFVNQCLSKLYRSCKWQTTGQAHLKDLVAFKKTVFKERLLLYSKSLHWSDHQLCNIISGPIQTRKYNLKEPIKQHAIV